MPRKRRNVMEPAGSRHGQNLGDDRRAGVRKKKVTASSRNREEYKQSTEMVVNFCLRRAEGGCRFQYTIPTLSLRNSKTHTDGRRCVHNFAEIYRAPK